MKQNPLLVSELFECILDHIATPPTYLEATRGAYAALARTCRAFSEPSLNRLWERLHSAQPLVLCSRLAVTSNTPSTSPSPVDWAVVTRYSCRVKELALLKRDDELFLESALRYMQSPFLFPNLTALDWTVSPDHKDAHLTMHRLLPSSLVSLYLTIHWTLETELFIQNYLSLCTRLKLKTFNLNIPKPPSQNGSISRSDIQHLSHVVRTHDRLKSLDLSVPLDDVTLRRVILSPQFKATSLVLHPTESNLGNMNFTSADTPFRNVKHLELFVWDLHFVSSLLRPKDQMFRKFFLHFGGLHEAKVVFSLLTSLASPQRTDWLLRIHLTRNEYAFSEPFNISYRNVIHRLTYDILQPLTSFKRLGELNLSLINQVFLKDEQLADLTRSWPMLQVLQLNCSNGCYGTPITLRGLLSVLENCPRLYKLALSVNARMVPEETAATTDVINTCLTSVQFPDSPICDPYEVADFLSAHIPFLMSVTVPFEPTPSIMYQPPGEYERLWNKVTRCLSLI